MIAKAKLRFTRISPKKARDVANLIRGKHIQEAQDILTNLNKKASRIIKNLLNSAVSNAKQANQNTEDTYVSKIVVNEGPFLKRYRSEAFGKASLIRRRLSHIELELENPTPAQKKKTSLPKKEELKHKVNSKKQRKTNKSTSKKKKGK